MFGVRGAADSGSITNVGRDDSSAGRFAGFAYFDKRFLGFAISIGRFAGFGFFVAALLGFRCASPQALCYRPLRGLRMSRQTLPGVSLRFTSGRGPRPSISAGVRDFMLSAAPRAEDGPAAGRPSSNISFIELDAVRFKELNEFISK